ncbi:hypothetical protein [Martelella alba]|uniref:Uncharacterized protein n=1 Tax=Martelella alba TaxID=2590451 RepID=A0ABY2SGP6_9HYPH|nr:hypothetical protein [Martelella alba]TKI02768.1 hypothetical protein FCN80_24025 [Martelella alba]
MKTMKKQRINDAATIAEAVEIIQEEPATTGGVSIQPLRRFNDGNVLRSPQDKPFTVSRLRAAELVANGLVVVIENIPGNRMRCPPETKG